MNRGQNQTHAGIAGGRCVRVGEGRQLVDDLLPMERGGWSGWVFVIRSSINLIRLFACSLSPFPSFSGTDFQILRILILYRTLSGQSVVSMEKIQDLQNHHHHAANNGPLGMKSKRQFGPPHSRSKRGGRGGGGKLVVSD